MRILVTDLGRSIPETMISEWMIDKIIHALFRRLESAEPSQSKAMTGEELSKATMLPLHDVRRELHTLADREWVKIPPSVADVTQWNISLTRAGISFFNTTPLAALRYARIEGV